MQTQDKLISALGLDDDEKVKRIKRILAMADKEGGLDEVEVSTSSSNDKSPTMSPSSSVLPCR